MAPKMAVDIGKAKIIQNKEIDFRLKVLIMYFESEVLIFYGDLMRSCLKKTLLAHCLTSGALLLAPALTSLFGTGALSLSGWLSCLLWGLSSSLCRGLCSCLCCGLL